VSLAVGHGELVAIIGGSGSGKTALLDAMAGLRAPSSGVVIRSTGATGYIPYGETMPSALPLARALRYTARLRGLADPDGAVDEVLRELDLTGRAAMPVGVLSGGERKRAAIAAELLAGPGLFFLDEPTGGLDPARGLEVMRALRERCDRGAAVVLTTQNSADADRCDKVAILATGGHLAFFGTPAAALHYFGADSLDEVYERLAGLGDPADAWSRRFFQYYRTAGGVSIPSVPPQPGPAQLVPDTAGPHSAGPPGPVGSDPGDALADSDPANDGPVPGLTIVPGDASGDVRAPGGDAGSSPGWATARVVRPVRQWAVLAARNTDGLLRTRELLAVLAGAPAAVLIASLLLFPSGAFSPAHPSPVADVTILFWTVFGGFFIGLGYGLPQVCTELGLLRRERFAGLGAGTYVLAKVAVLVPALAVADALVLAVFGALGRLPEGREFGAAFVTLLLASAAAAGLGLMVSAAVSQLSRAMVGAVVASLPQVLFAGAILPVSAMVLVGRWISYLMTDRWAFDALGHSMGVHALWTSGHSALGPPLLASYGTAFDRPVWNDWLILAGFAAVFVAAAITAVARRTHAPVGDFTPAAGQAAAPS
jgi:ABC-type multidrug transport system ATPase subunit/ABC-type multidrug transport system permease subunit